MAGRISDGDIERVREANRIDQVVAEYVALRPAGGGNLKGLCPFHDEKTPSFQVSPARAGGRYHCFGCGQGGDVFEFVREMEHLTFMEAVERLADRGNITLTLVEGGSAPKLDRGTRARLLAANKAAAEFYVAQLATDEAAPAREYLSTRGFDDAATQHFGCGFAPSGWDRLVKALTGQGFSLAELEKAGLSRQGQRGPIDVFHRRLLWPIRDPAGDVVGFGARRIFDDDRLEAKYVNTHETMLYKKSQVLFGLDLAKREIAKQRTAVVVEGYTDVMAMHLSGITTAVASCGTAFGEEHITVLRRYLQDSETAKVIYTFDGDNAGQQAALKAFESDQRFTAGTYVCVAPDGMDPCELRQARGDQAVRDLVTRRQPLFAFAIEHTVDRFDLDTAEGTVAAAAAAVPLVARIRDSVLRDEYALRLAGLIGADHQQILRRVRGQAKADRERGAQQNARPAAPVPEDSGPQQQAPAPRMPDAADRSLFAEREALKLVLQEPQLLAAGYDHLDDTAFGHPAYLRVHQAVLKAGGPGTASGAGLGTWVDRVAAELPSGPLRSLVTELAVESLRSLGPATASYAGAMLAVLAIRVAEQRIAELRSELQRAEARGDQERAGEASGELMEMQTYLRALRERANGS
ncbi:DNA primase [Nakamurella sp. YIM 132087]|uniref:DNA primase n=1 Tax=Nakamurella alba TaxID=2665158 RepID=A0A7K1FHE4_9ACTN|nr:DNA primase [Nakamurella alba]MTD13545.1 DNA primase [Nakamurella alba]